MIYSIGSGTFNLRRFRIDDYLQGAAELIHGTDPYIYPYWQRDPTDFREEIFPLMQDTNFIFSYRNLYGAFYQTPCGCEIPVGVLLLLDAETPLDYDYSGLKQIDRHHDFVVTHYIEKIIQERHAMPRKAILVVCLNIDPEYRKHGLAKKLLATACEEKSRQGYRQLHLDCLQKNTPALHLYQKIGCQIFGEGIGFDGSVSSKVKIYHLAMDI